MNNPLAPLMKHILTIGPPRINRIIVTQDYYDDNIKNIDHIDPNISNKLTNNFYGIPVIIWDNIPAHIHYILMDDNWETVATGKRPLRRVQVQSWRKKGGRKPDNVEVVARPSRFGNPFTVKQLQDLGYQWDHDRMIDHCIVAFKDWLENEKSDYWSGPEANAARKKILEGLPFLAGKDLACYCPLDKPCHADILLQLANRDI